MSDLFRESPQMAGVSCGVTWFVQKVHDTQLVLV